MDERVLWDVVMDLDVIMGVLENIFMFFLLTGMWMMVIELIKLA